MLTGPSGALHKRALSFPYGSTKVRGVNLGGWFVLERTSPALPSSAATCCNTV